VIDMGDNTEIAYLFHKHKKGPRIPGFKGSSERITG